MGGAGTDSPKTGLTSPLSCGIMDVDKLRRDVVKLREQAAEIVAPGFSYYQQELIRRVIKAVLPQFKNQSDINIAKEILSKTEWLDEGK